MATKKVILKVREAREAIYKVGGNGPTTFVFESIGPLTPDEIKQVMSSPEVYVEIAKGKKKT